MEKDRFSRPLDESIGSSIRHYVNMQIDRAAMKGAEKMSWVSNKVIVTTIFIVAGSIILLFLGIALALFLGDVMNSYALGFLSVAGAVLIIAAVIYLLRKKLFANQMAKMYTRMLLGDDKVSGMDELHLRQQFVDQQIEDKEEAFAQEYRMFKQMLNPLTYLNQFINGVRDLFRKDPKEQSEPEKTSAPQNDIQSSEEKDNDGYQASQF